MMGNGNKEIDAEMQEVASAAFRSIVARRNIVPGEILSLENVSFLRMPPGQGGLSTARWHEISGRITGSSVERGKPIKLAQLTNE